MVGDERYREIIDEMKNREENKGGETMCEIYDQIEQQGIEKGIQEGIQKGIQEGIISLYKKGIITLSDASKELSVSEEEFLNMLVME